MPKNVFDTEKRTCDRCGFDHRKSALRKQRGLWLGDDCFDNLDRIQQPRVRWQIPRDNSTTVAIPPESTSTVFVVSAGTGIDQISQSIPESERRDGRHISTYMEVVSDGGAIVLTADPQIVGAPQFGDLLTLRGTSDIDTIEIHDDDGVRTIGGQNGVGRPFVLDSKSTISFVYSLIDAGFGSSPWGQNWGGNAPINIPAWIETSRFKGGL